MGDGGERAEGRGTQVDGLQTTEGRERRKGGGEEEDEAGLTTPKPQEDPTQLQLDDPQP